MKPLRELLRSSKPPPEGFRYRPRQRPYRAMLWFVGMFQILILGLLVYLGWQWSSGEWSEAGPFWFLLPVVLVPLLLGLSLHAQWGAKAGEVPAPLQLWRWPQLRGLPELPPLKPLQLLLIYGLPTLGMVALVWVSGIASAWQDIQQLNSPEQATEWWSGRGWVQVSCTEVPLVHTEQSLCYMPTGAVDGKATETALKEWLTRALTTYELGEQPERIVRPLPDLNIQRGGGIMTSQIKLILPHDTAFKTTDHAYALSFLARDPKATGPLPNGWTEQQAKWVKRQPFAGVLVLTQQ